MLIFTVDLLAGDDITVEAGKACDYAKAHNVALRVNFNGKRLFVHSRSKPDEIIAEALGKDA